MFLESARNFAVANRFRAEGSYADWLAPRPAEVLSFPSGSWLAPGCARRRFFWRAGDGGRASPAQTERVAQKQGDLRGFALHAGELFDALDSLRHGVRRPFGKTGFQRRHVRDQAALGSLPVFG